MKPHMSEEEILFFSKFLQKEISYIEYGCGGSTVYVEDKVKDIISVDTDNAWVQKIKQEMKSTESKIIEYVDIGEITNWGRPKDFTGFKEYYKYVTKPWVLASTYNIVPGLVLIDGRFRVACFLFSLLCANAGTKILIHDYVSRTDYHVVENFCQPYLTFETFGVFEIPKKEVVDVSKITETLLSYVYDYK